MRPISFPRCGHVNLSAKQEREKKEGKREKDPSECEDAKIQHKQKDKEAE